MMSNPLELKSREQIAGDLFRTILVNSDLTDIAPGSSLATLIEAIASLEFQIQMSVLKILESSNIESLIGVSLDKKAQSIGLPNTIGGSGRIPASPASGTVRIGSGFSKVSSKPYAGKPAPFQGSKRLYLENASGFNPTGKIYIGRGTPDRFEGPIDYLSVTNSGSFWTVELASPLTKSHPHSDLVVMAQGGDRLIPAGTAVIVPASSNSPAITFTTSFALTIEDGESEGTVSVACSVFGESGNALAGAIKQFSSSPFTGATVTNPTSFINGRSTESDEDLRRRIKNYPSTLSRGTKSAILAALQGARDPGTGRTITSASIIEPVTPGDSSKVYIDDSTGLEPTFNSQPYELLLKSASGQETQFRSAQFPITAPVAIGAEFGPFSIQGGQSLTVVVDGVAETYTVTARNYISVNSASAFEIVRDFNSQSSLIGWRTADGGNRVVAFDLSGEAETIRVEASDLQKILGLVSDIDIRSIYLYKNSKILSFRGRSATLSTSPYPWSLIPSDLSNVRVAVDGIIQEFSITDSDFAEYATTVASASLTQWAEVFSKKIAGVQFTVVGNIIVWKTFQQFSEKGSLEILKEKASGAQATWIGASKIWESEESGGILKDVGSTQDYELNRFSGQIRLINKPDAGDTIEIGSRSTRAAVRSLKTPSGQFTLSPIVPGIGNSKIVVSFDGEFAVRDNVISSTAAFTPSQPDPVGASNIIRLTSNDTVLFRGAATGDYIYIVKDSVVSPSWGNNIEGLYLLKRVGVNGAATAQAYSSVDVSVENGSSVVTVNQVGHGFKTGAQISVADIGTIGGVSVAASFATITVIDNDNYTYTMASPATFDSTGNVDTITYHPDAWIEFEVSDQQLVDWSSLLLAPQSIAQWMVSLFKSTSIPQVVDFGSVSSVTVDDIVSIVNSQIKGGTASKLDPTSLVIRSNSFAGGTSAVLAIIGNGESVFQKAVSSSIQPHVGFSSSNYVQGGFPVVTGLVVGSEPEEGFATRSYLIVDKDLTEITGTGSNPTIEASSFSVNYPVGFQNTWITGKQYGLTGRVYNNSSTFPYAGFMRSEDAIKPLQSSGSTQTSPNTLNQYSNISLRLNDIPLTEFDKLVVELDQNQVDKTVAVPMYKKAQIQDIDAITGDGQGQVVSFRLKDPEDLDPSNSNLPRPFFDPTSVYRNFNFNDFKLLAKSIGIYKDSTGANVSARGSLTAISAIPGVSIEDGDTFTLDDGINPPTVFEFDDNSSVVSGNIPVSFPLAVKETGSLTAISAVPGVSIEEGNTFTLNDGINLPTTFEFDSDSFVLGSNVPVSFVAGLKAVGSLTAVAADPSTGIADGDTFTLDDGINPPTVFEFDTDSTVTPGNYPVAISSVETASVIKALIISAINSAPSLNISAASGSGDLIQLSNDSYGLVGNTGPIAESFANVGVTLTPIDMAGGLEWPDSAAIKAAIISAINSAPSLNISATPGAGMVIDLENSEYGNFGNTITETISNSSTLTPSGMAGGVDTSSPSTIKAAMVSAINSVGATLNISAASGAGMAIDLVNNNPGTLGNNSIAQSISNGQTLSPSGMAGGTDIAYSDKAIVLRSVSYGAKSKLRMSIRYGTEPSVSQVKVSHINSYRDGVARTTLLVNLPTSSTLSGSTFDAGFYTVESIQSNNLTKLRFSAVGLNPSSQYVAGNILNVSGSGALAGSYKITYAASGLVEVLAPGIDFVTPVNYDASENPLRSFSLPNTTLGAIVTAINDYSPENPVATAEALGTGLNTYYISNPTYISSENLFAPYLGSKMTEAFDYHSFECKHSGSAGIFQYDSFNPALNNIKALVQTSDSIFPNLTDAAGTTYSPINEDVVIVPSNSITLERWLNFTAVSSASVLSNIEIIDGLNKVQISSKQDGALGAVKITGVTANSVESFVLGNAVLDGDASKAKILFSDAKSIPVGSLIKVENSVASEIQRAYRTLPTGSSVTPANTEDISPYFRNTTAIRYIKTGLNTARLIFLRNGIGPGQSEFLNPGEYINLTPLGNGLVQVTATVAAGVLSARTGDMMYIRPQVGSFFPSTYQCKALDMDGISDPANPEYWGYPVVHVIDAQSVVVIAPNITSPGSYLLATETDLVFMPAIWNEKNIRTNREEGINFETLSNSGNANILVKKLGGNMLSIWMQNSSAEATDDMVLSNMSVSSDDYVVLGEGFNIANRGTFKLLAHNGRNHIIVHNPSGGADEIIDTTTYEGGGNGTRKWGIGPITAARPIRVLDGESVRIGDRLRISAPLTSSQWFPSSMLGSWEITGIGLIGRDFTSATLPYNGSDGTLDNSLISPFVDIAIPNSPSGILDSTNNYVDAFLLAGNVGSIGFIEKTPYEGFRIVAGSSSNPQNPEESELFMVPQKSTHKITDIFGSKITAQYKVGYEQRTFSGIDGYKVYGGLVQESHKIIDGSPVDSITYPGVRASGTRIEILPPLIKAISISLVVRPKDGVTLNSIGDVIRASVASYINGLGVGRAVVLSEIIKIVQSLPGVFSVQIVGSLPQALDDRIPVSDIEKAFVLDANRDISVG
jgi:hypothetical protein